MSESSRGRGKDRGKELTPNERVSQWVNKREAQRLNRLRWAGREQTSDLLETDDKNSKECQQEKSETAESIQKHRPQKVQNVPLYVPPSLRAKRAANVNAEGDSSQTPPPVPQAHNTEMNVGTPGGDGLNLTGDAPRLSSAGKGRGRGRGRKKVDMEVYVPRALRAAQERNRSDGMVPAKKESNRLKPYDVEKNEIDNLKQNEIDDGGRNSINDEHINLLDTNQSVISRHSSNITDTESSKFANHGHSHEEASLYVSTVVDTHADSSASPHCGHNSLVEEENIATFNKMETETPANSNTNLILSSKDAGDTIMNKNMLEDPGESQKEGSYTFEFYDPAVVAFMPSSLNSPSANSSENRDENSNNNPNVDSSFSQVFSSPNPSNSMDTADLNTDIENKNASDVRPSVTTEGVVSSSSTASSVVNLTDQESCVNYHNSTKAIPDASAATHKFPPEFNQPELQDNAIISPCENDSVSEIKKTLPEPKNQCDSDTQIIQPCLSEPASFSSPVPQSVQHPVTGIEATVSSSEVETTGGKMYPNNASFSQKEEKEIQGNNTEIFASGKQQMDERGDKPFTADENDDVEDSWDAIFDDNGDCLDESLMEELVEKVGKVEVDKPTINYLKFEPKEPEVSLEVFGHIVEIYDFSPELATHDIISAFSDFASRGFDVKWVDDTHALGVFSSTVAANEALRLNHPLLKVRPMSQASKKGLSKAKHCQEFLQPYKARPQTTSLAARRLVAGALGMAPKVSREVRDKERQKLKEAKEKRRQDRQQKVDIWDGSFGKCAMDDK